MGTSFKWPRSLIHWLFHILFHECLNHEDEVMGLVDKLSKNKNDTRKGASIRSR